MDKEYFNVSMNKIGFKILDLKESTIDEIPSDIEEIEKQLDNFKEECLKKIKFNSKPQAPRYKRQPTIRRNPKGCKKRYSRVNGVR